jgi:hypothetical protein
MSRKQPCGVCGAAIARAVRAEDRTKEERAQHIAREQSILRRVQRLELQLGTALRTIEGLRREVPRRRPVDVRRIS